MVGDRIRGDFDEELRNAAGALAAETRVATDPTTGEPVLFAPRLHDFAMAEDAVIRVVDDDGNPLAATEPSAPLGPPRPGTQDVGGLKVATEPIAATELQDCRSSNMHGPTMTSTPPSAASGSSSAPECWAAPCSPCSPALRSPTARCGRSPR